MPFKPGQSGNPHGRAKGAVSLARQTAKYMGGRDKEAGKPRAVVMAEVLYGLAKKGNVPALTYLFDRLEGRPAQAVQVSGDAERPIHIVAGIAPRTFEAPRVEEPDRLMSPSLESEEPDITREEAKGEGVDTD